MKSFRKDRRGIGWVLGVAALSLFIWPFIYFPLDLAWDMLYGAIVADYTFTGTIALAIIAVRIIISYLLTLGIFALIAWSVVQAKARKYAP